MFKKIKISNSQLCSSRFQIRKAEHGSATTWSGCSRAKPTAHTGSGIPFSTLLLALFLTVFFVGCGNKFVPFGGKVTTSDGKPYTKGYVIFSNGQYSARGKLQSDGNYVLDSLGEGDGLSPGTYRVYLSAFQENVGTDNEPVYVSDINLKYEDPDTSGLSCEVKKGGHFDFVVESK